MDSAIAPDRHSASAERVDSSSVLVSEGLLTPPPQPSFAAAVSSSSAPPRGAHGLLVFVMRLITSSSESEADHTVSSLRNYAGAVMLGELSSDHHRERQNHSGTSRGA